MYYYILDLGNRKIAKIKEKMEMIMASYGISGDFGKISPLASAYELAKRAIELRYKTIVAIGDARVINQVASALIQSEAVLGIIPIDAPSSICTLIGAYNYQKALEVLRVRKVETIDIGKIGEDKYFLTEAQIVNSRPIPTVLDFGGFKAGGSFSEIIIKNGNNTKESFKDGYFKISLDERKPRVFGLFQKKLHPFSRFFADEIKIESEEQSNVLVDEETVAKTPCKIRLIPLALKIIVARRG